MERIARGILLSIVAWAAAASASPLPGAPANASAVEAVAALEYWARESAGGLQAPNRAHDLRTWFDASGVRVHARTATGSPLLIGLSLAGIGRGEAVREVGRGRSVAASRNRVEIHRDGIVEWYVNAPSGLEQGFTLLERPSGEGRLVVDVAVEGARAALEEGAVHFVSRGRRLRYGKLHVVDAKGATLPARLAIATPQRLRIEVDDAGAAFPIVIDPLLESTADGRLEGNQGGAQFGASVAGAGDVNQDGYDDVIVGALRWDGGEGNEGAAFVFHGGPGGLGVNPAPAATIQGNELNASLGWSVAGLGDVNGDGYDDVAIGGHTFGLAPQADEGIVLVFLGGPGGIASGGPGDADARIESNVANAQLGFSITGGDFDGDGYGDLAAGARWYVNGSGQSQEGGVFVFRGGASGIPDGDPNSADAVFEGNQAGANLGASLGAGDFNGDGYDDLLVGATNYDAGQTNEGAAFIFLGSPTGLASGDPSTAATQLEGGQTSASFGIAVASARDVNGDGYDDVLIGAPLFDNGQTNEGAALLFHGSATGIADAAAATADTILETNGGSVGFGAAVAGVGDVDGDGFDDVIVGANTLDGAFNDQGGAFVFLGSELGVPDAAIASADVSVLGGQTSALMGWSVAGIGDVDGDDGTDVAVGLLSYEANPEDSDEGVVFVYHGVPAPETGSVAAGAVAIAALVRLRRRQSEGGSLAKRRRAATSR